MFEDFENEFGSNEIDPVEAAKLQELYEEEIENSMREALHMIESMGIENWIRSNRIPMTSDRKKKILENMITWFSAPEREEYETAAILKKGLDKMKI